MPRFTQIDLCNACADKQGLERVKKIVAEPNMDINFLDPENLMCPIDHAASTGSLETLQFLLSHKDIQFDAKDGRFNLLDYGISNTSDVKAFLCRTRNSLVPKFNDGTCISHMLAISGTLENFKLYVAQRPTELHARNNKGYTPLFYAVLAGNNSVVDYLLQTDEKDKYFDYNNALYFFAKALVEEYLSIKVEYFETSKVFFNKFYSKNRLTEYSLDLQRSWTFLLEHYAKYNSNFCSFLAVEEVYTYRGLLEEGLEFCNKVLFCQDTLITKFPIDALRKKLTLKFKAFISYQLAKALSADIFAEDVIQNYYTSIHLFNESQKILFNFISETKSRNTYFLNQIPTAEILWSDLADQYAEWAKIVLQKNSPSVACYYDVINSLNIACYAKSQALSHYTANFPQDIDVSNISACHKDLAQYFINLANVSREILNTYEEDLLENLQHIYTQADKTINYVCHAVFYVQKIKGTSYYEGLPGGATLLDEFLKECIAHPALIFARAIEREPDKIPIGYIDHAIYRLKGALNQLKTFESNSLVMQNTWHTDLAKLQTYTRDYYKNCPKSEHYAPESVAFKRFARSHGLFVNVQKNNKLSKDHSIILPSITQPR